MAVTTYPLKVLAWRDSVRSMGGTVGVHVRGNAVAYVALFIALGGTSYAATLPRNSVGSKQLKANAVTSAKVKNRSLRATDFATGVLTRGPRGPQGPAGPAGANAETLQSGRTVRGRWDATRTGPGAVGIAAFDAISFGVQLATAPARTIVLTPPGPAQCPGTVAEPDATPGNLCIYVGDRVNTSTIETVLDGVATGATSRQGTSVYAVSTSDGSFGARGSWAVTAP